METIKSRDGFAYWGESEGWYIAYSAANCGDLLDKANLEAFRRALPEGSYRVEEFGGGLRGVSIETLLIDPERADAIEEAESILAQLEDYPVIDDELYSEYEYNEALESAEAACDIDRANAAAAAPYICNVAFEDGRRDTCDFWPTPEEVFFGYLRYRRTVRADQVREAEHASEREDFAALGCEDCQSAIDREVKS